MSTADSAAVEALARILFEGSVSWDSLGALTQRQHQAATILASEWLAARDAAMRAEGAATALRETTLAWQFGGWADVLPKVGTGLMTWPQAVTDWLRARADAALNRTEGDA